MSNAWERCLDRLEVDLTPEQFNTWIRPLHAVEDGSILRLLAPNHFVRDWVSKHFLDLITTIATRCESAATDVTVQVGSRKSATSVGNESYRATDTLHVPRPPCGLRTEFTFENFVEGKSNQMARAASMQVAANPRDTENNPLFIYGGVGLGKTHLMHAIGNRMLQENLGVNVVYLHSEQFVAKMVTALQHNRINEFKSLYRSVDALLIDDIQFFAGKERSQEEFFHTFNRLLERERLVVLTSDRYPKEIHGLENRLKTRFGGGLPIAIEPPELETRAAILMNKAATTDMAVPDDVAYFIAQTDAVECTRAGRGVAPRHCHREVHGTCGHDRFGQGGIARPSCVTGETCHCRKYPAHRRAILQNTCHRLDIQETHPVHRTTTSYRDGACQRPDEPQLAGNW